MNGIPPSSVNANIVTMVKRFYPITNIKEFPSMSNICRVRTVVFIIIQTLAAYCLGRANKWGQLFTDAIVRRQISFQN